MSRTSTCRWAKNDRRLWRRQKSRCLINSMKELTFSSFSKTWQNAGDSKERFLHQVSIPWPSVTFSTPTNRMIGISWGTTPSSNKSIRGRKEHRESSSLRTSPQQVLTCSRNVTWLWRSDPESCTSISRSWVEVIALISQLPRRRVLSPMNTAWNRTRLNILWNRTSSTKSKEQANESASDWKWRRVGQKDNSHC